MTRRIPVFFLVQELNGTLPERSLQKAVDKYAEGARPLAEGEAARTHFFIPVRQHEAMKVAKALRSEVERRKVAVLQGRMELVA